MDQECKTYAVMMEEAGSRCGEVDAYLLGKGVDVPCGNMLMKVI